MSEIDDDVKKMKEMETDNDYEDVRVKADRIIIKYLPQKIKKAYLKLEENFWYS